MSLLFRADMSSSVHVNNKGKGILIFGKGPTQGLVDTILTAETIYPINFTEPNKRFVLSLHYTGSNNFLLVNATKIYHFKAQKSDIRDYTLCFGNISAYFFISNLKKGIRRSCKFFSATDDILNIHKYLMKRK